MVIYTTVVKCDRCNYVIQTVFPIPTPLLDMRDQGRKAAKDTGWMTVRESGEKKDYCFRCVEEMKMKVKA